MLYRVLVADNSNHDLRHYSMMPVFGECGFEISGHTADLGAAVSSALRREYDVLLCINRPAAVIATDLLKRAAKAKLQAPVIVLSKVNAANDMRDCFLLGAVDYLTEPVLEDVVRAALLRAVKAIGRNITSAEFDRAMKDAFELIPPDSKNGSFTEKLRELLEKIQGGALTVEEAARLGHEKVSTTINTSKGHTHTINNNYAISILKRNLRLFASGSFLFIQSTILPLSFMILIKLFITFCESVRL